jgi:hypothetical protein
MRAQLTLKAYPERLVFFHGQTRIAEHPRSYERRRDFEHPDHPRPLLENRFRAHQQRNLLRFLQLGPAAEPYYHQLRERRGNAHQHVARIVALSEIHGTDATARAWPTPWNTRPSVPICRQSPGPASASAHQAGRFAPDPRQ